MQVGFLHGVDIAHLGGSVPGLSRIVTPGSSAAGSAVWPQDPPGTDLAGFRRRRAVTAEPEAVSRKLSVDRHLGCTERLVWGTSANLPERRGTPYHDPQSESGGIQVEMHRSYRGLNIANIETMQTVEP